MTIQVAVDNYTHRYVAYDSDSICTCISYPDPVGMGDTEDEAVKDLENIMKHRELYSIEDIREEYLDTDMPYKSFHEYKEDNFTQVYDDELNFIGFERNTALNRNEVYHG